MADSGSLTRLIVYLFGAEGDDCHLHCAGVQAAIQKGVASGVYLELVYVDHESGVEFFSVDESDLVRNPMSGSVVNGGSLHWGRRDFYMVSASVPRGGALVRPPYYNVVSSRPSSPEPLGHLALDTYRNAHMSFSVDTPVPYPAVLLEAAAAAAHVGNVLGSIPPPAMSHFPYYMDPII
jgi:hypothetical protein